MAKVVTEFVVNADQAFATADKVQERYEKLATETTTAINSISENAAFGKNFSDQIAFVERRTLSLRQELRNISNITVGVKGFDGLGQAVLRAQKDLTVTYERLRQIEVEASKTANPVILQKLSVEAAELNGQLDRLQNKMDRVGKSRAGGIGGGGSGVKSGLINAGVTGIASGIDPNLGLLASALPNATVEAGVTSAATSAGSALGVTSLGALATTLAGLVPPLAAIGALVVKYSKEAKEEADQRLKTEERIAVAYGKQASAQFEALESYRKQAQLSQEQYDRNKLLAGQDAEHLQHIKELNELLFKLDPTGAGAKDYAATAQAAAEAQRLAADREQKQNLDNLHHDFQELTRLQDQFREQRKADFQKGVTQIQELGKTYVDTLDKISRLNASNNPFVTAILDSDKALEELKRNIRGLPADVQKAFIDAQNNATRTQLFNTRLDTRLQALDLRDQAAQFRSQGGSAYIDKQIESALQKFQASVNGGATRNLSAFISYLGNQGASPQERLRLFDLRQQSEQQSGLYRNPEFEAEDRARLVRAVKDDSVQEKLDRQLKIIDKLNPTTAEEKAAADRKIIAITQGLDPKELTRTQIEAAAGAREREAARLINAEAEARKLDVERNKLLEKIDQNQQRLLKAVEEGGTKSLADKLKIVVQDETKGGISTDIPKPTPKDTAQTYDPSLLLTGGPGGLSNI